MQQIETDLGEAQVAIGEWAEENFGAEQPTDFPLYGIGEEIGEFSTSVLKIAQGIDDADKYQDRVGPDAEMDALGDIFIYLMDFSYRAGIDVGEMEFDSPRVTPTELTARAAGYGVEPVGLYAGFELYWQLATLSKVYIKGSNGVADEVYELIHLLRAICELRGYSFDVAIQETMDEVLDRVWDADVQV